MCAEHVPAFSDLLRRHRRAAGLTQEELAERAGISSRAVGDLERGIRQPRRDTMRLLLSALELSADETARLETAARGSLPSTSIPPTHLQTGSFLGALPSIDLIGRDAPLHRIRAAVEAVSGGSGHFVAIAGEPGIGKTRIAQEATREASSRGFLVTTGRCYEQEQSTPFYPFLEALGLAYRRAPSIIREEVPRRWPHLVMLLPEDAVASPAQATNWWTTGLEGQQRLFRAVSGFLQSIAEVAPIAILVDDLHWADDASLKLLLHLARHMRGERVLIVGTYRDVEVDARHPLEQSLVDLDRERLVERIVVDRLDLQGTIQLIGETLGGNVTVWPGLAAMIHEVTGGNPFFVQEVLNMLISHGDLYEEDGAWHRRDIPEIHPPETVVAAIQQRLARLPAPVSTVLHEACVLGQAFDFEDLRALGNYGEDDLDGALEAASGAGFVRETRPDHYVYNHALTQYALYCDLTNRRRRRLHLEVGQMLGQLPRQVQERRAAEIARHFRLGRDLRQALAYTMMAGDRAESLFAYEDAQRHFRAAVNLTSLTTEGLSDPLLRARALARLGRVLDVGERYDEALDVLEQAAEIYRAQGDRESEVSSVAEIGWIHHNRRTDEQGIALIQPLIAALDEEPPSSRRDRMLAILHTALARLFFGLGRYRDEVDAAERAVAMAREVGFDELLAVAEARQGAALMTLGRRDEAREALEQASVLAEATGNLGTLSVALDNLGEIACDGGDYRLSRTQCERAVEVAEQIGLPGRLGWTLVKLGRIQLLTGAWQAARATFERSAQLFEEDVRSATYPRIHLAQLEAWTAGTPAAVIELEAVTHAAAEARDRWLVRYGSRILAELELLDGRPSAASDRLAPLLDGQGKNEPQAVLLYAPLAWAYMDSGREGDAERTLAEGMEQARLHSHEVARADLLRVQGMLRSRQGRWDEAQHALGEAIDSAQRMPDPYREAQYRTEMSVLASRMGDEKVAREQGEQALAIARSIDALPSVQYIERVMRRRSAEPRAGR